MISHAPLTTAAWPITLVIGLANICGHTSEFDHKNNIYYVLVPLCTMSRYHYVLCPGTTMCYVQVPLCVMSWYHYVLCPGTTMCYVLVPLCVMSWYHYVLCPGTTMCYVLVPLCVMSWYHCVYFHWSEIARPFFFTYKPVNLQVSPHKPISIQKVLYMQSLLTPTEHWLASPGTSATFRAGPWGHLRHTCPWSVPSGLPPVPVYVALPIWFFG